MRATPDGVFAELSTATALRLAQWERGARFAAIRDEWLKRAFGLGKTVRIALPEGEREGRFEGIDAAGRMLLRRPDGASETVTAGDVLPALARV